MPFTVMKRTRLRTLGVLIVFLGLGAVVSNWMLVSVAQEPTQFTKEKSEQFFSSKSKLFSKENLGSSQPSQWTDKPWHGKSMSPFKAQTSFQWIDESAGVGKVRVELSAKSFIEQTWTYQWILPSNVMTQSDLSAHFESLRFQKVQVFELEVSGLDGNQNQNLFLRLKPVMKKDSAMTILISTHEAQTVEGITQKAFSQSSKIQSLRKNLGAPAGSPGSPSPPRIQF